MTAVSAGGFVRDDPVVFAQNQLEIAVPIDNPGSVTGLDDFANPDLLLGLCAPAVPCGDFSLRALASAGIEPTVDSNEPDVRALLTKIEAGELDAGIVYATDVVSRGGDIEGVPIPTAFNVVAEYPIAVLTGGANAPGATLFVAFVTSSSGRAILAEHGFVLP
jgi:molybdate transport system substrate-binding protein